MARIPDVGYTIIIAITGIANDIDTSFSVFSLGTIKRQHNKGKLIEDLADALR